jgi:hypothetical protein
MKERRQVREDETSYKIWTPVTRRPTEKEAQESGPPAARSNVTPTVGLSSRSSASSR